MIKRLEWDSSFFSKEIGRVDIDKDFDEQLLYAEAQKYDLIYVFSEKPININAELVDVKHIYIKRTIHNKNVLELNHKIEHFCSNQHDYNKLLKLAYLSGHESRFRKDPFFGEENFKRLYKKWIDKNINEDNNSVLIYKVENKIVGFVSYLIKGEEACIELIAVDNSYQGLGIGKKLMKAVEYSTPVKFKFIVPTQESNSKACKFYKKYGFDLVQKQYIYHYVNKKEKC